MEAVTDYLVIGAGLAGLAFASEIRRGGATVRLLDKGRGIGGRMATRRLADGANTVTMDHGAQFFTARGERLQRLVDSGLAEGWLAVWSHGFPLWKEGKIHEREPGNPRYAPPAGMNELARQLAAGLDILTRTTVVQIGPTDFGYQAVTDDGRTFGGRHLMLNLPPVQLLNLAQYLLSDEMSERIRTVEFLPAWTLIANLENDISGADWPALEFDHPVLGWVSRDHTKRRSEVVAPTLIAHGSGEWSREHLEEAPGTIERMLLNALQETIGAVRPREIQAHRWRYALPTRPLSTSFLWDAERKIGCCGDWCGGPRVEGALESGWALAGAVRS